MGSLGMDFYSYLPFLIDDSVAQQIYWYTAFVPSMIAPGPTVNEDGTPKWRMAPSPHGSYWEEGMKLGYQDCDSWTFMKTQFRISNCPKGNRLTLTTASAKYGP